MKKIILVTVITGIAAISVGYFVQRKKARNNIVILDFTEYALGGY